MTRKKKLLLGAATVLGALLLAEGGARLHYRGRWPYPFVFDEELLWRPRPGWSGEVRGDARATFNALGLREEREPGAVKDARRVVILGDSIAYGYALPQERTISRRLEARWSAAHPGRPLEAWNAGVPGYGPEQAARLLRRLGPRLEPDVVAFLLCMRNDLGVEPVARSLARRGLLNPGEKRLAVRSAPLRALLDRSALAFAVARFVHRQRTRAWRAEHAPAETQLRFVRPEVLVALPRAEQDRVFAELEARLGEVRAAAEATGARSVLVICPGQGLLDGTQDPALVDRAAEAGRRVGLPVLDLLPRYRAAGAPVLRPKDGIHPNEAGADAIAGWLLEFLAAEGLLGE